MFPFLVISEWVRNACFASVSILGQSTKFYLCQTLVNLSCGGCAKKASPARLMVWPESWGLDLGTALQPRFFFFPQFIVSGRSCILGYSARASCKPRNSKSHSASHLDSSSPRCDILWVNRRWHTTALRDILPLGPPLLYSMAGFSITLLAPKPPFDCRCLHSANRWPIIWVNRSLALWALQVKYNSIFIQLLSKLLNIISWKWLGHQESCTKPCANIERSAFKHLTWQNECIDRA